MTFTSILQVFEETVARFPDRIAIQQGQRSLTYRDLNARADLLADALMRLGVHKRAIVAIYLDACVEYVVAMLSIMKAGTIFMPLTPNFPSRHMGAVVRKTRPAAFVTHHSLEKALTRKLEENRITVQDNHLLRLNGTSAFAVSHDWIKQDVRRSHLPSRPISEHFTEDLEDACYLITTSGSTGKPKAILGSLRGLSHFIHWETRELKLDETTRASLLSAVTFDVSLRDIWVPLCIGGTLCIPDEQMKSSGTLLAKWLKDSRISLVHIVPTLFRLITRSIETNNVYMENVFPDLKYILLAGEVLYGIDILRWKAAAKCQAQLYNLYGPSETTLAKLFMPIAEENLSPNESIPLGRPIPGAEAMVLEDGKPCTIGEVGEIYIRTPYMSKGYIDDVGLNEAAFVQNPLVEHRDIVYKTGDLGRYLHDMTIKFEGRVDTQIKLRGIRIETGEIETHLREHPDLIDAAVVAREDASQAMTLIAYVVPLPGKKPTVETLRPYLSERLPGYMVPSKFITLPDLPLTHNGKIDRTALPAPKASRPEMATLFVPPASRLEQSLAAIWCRVLNLDRVGIDDSFFDLGGTSLLVVRMLSAIGDELGITLSVGELFQAPTIKQISRLLTSRQTDLLSTGDIEARALRKRAVASRRRKAFHRTHSLK